MKSQARQRYELYEMWQYCLPGSVSGTVQNFWCVYNHLAAECHKQQHSHRYTFICRWYCFLLFSLCESRNSAYRENVFSINFVYVLVLCEG